MATRRTTTTTRSSKGTVPKKPAPRARAKAPAAAPTPVLLSGENPQIAKADGDAPVQAYLAAVPGWKGELVRALDALIVTTVPGVRKAVKWNSPFYGVPGQGWFVSLHVFAKYVKLTFFKGTSLTPPPAGGEAREARWINLHEHDLARTEPQLTAWIQQAAALPGWL